MERLSVKKALVAFLLIILPTVLFAGDLSYKLSPSYNGFDILISNGTNEDVIIPEFLDGGCFRFLIFTSSDLAISNPTFPRSSLGFIPPKFAILIQSRKTEGVHFEKLVDFVPKSEFPVYLFGLFKKIIGSKKRYDFFGPILVQCQEGMRYPSYSLFTGALPAEIQSRFEKTFASVKE